MAYLEWLWLALLTGVVVRREWLAREAAMRALVQGELAARMDIVRQRARERVTAAGGGRALIREVLAAKRAKDASAPATSE